MFAGLQTVDAFPLPQRLTAAACLFLYCAQGREGARGVRGVTVEHLNRHYPPDGLVQLSPLGELVALEAHLGTGGCPRMDEDGDYLRQEAAPLLLRNRLARNPRSCRCPSQSPVAA